MGGWGMLAGQMSGGTILALNGNWAGTSWGYSTSTSTSSTTGGSVTGGLNGTSVTTGTYSTNTSGYSGLIGGFSFSGSYSSYGYASSNGPSPTPGTPTASDADGDGQVDDISTTAGIIRWGANLGFPIPSLPFNLALSFDFDAYFEDLKDKFICAVLHNSNDALAAVNTQINAIGLQDDTFDALQNIVRGAFILGDVLSFRGLSLADVLTNLGTLNIQDGPLNGVPGVYIPDGNNILIDTDGIRNQYTTTDPASYEERLLDVIIHEIGHSQDAISGGPSTPWTSHYHSGGDNSLQMWAEQIAARMLRHAEQNGFETFDEFMDDLGAKCAAGHGGGQNQVLPDVVEPHLVPEMDNNADFVIDAFF